jgi:asparagine synthase (glutamine-hydrolysing)
VRKLRRAVRALGLPPDGGYAALTRVASVDDAAEMLAGRVEGSPFRDQVEQLFRKAPGNDELSKTLSADLALVLPNDMLAKVDQASMLNSLETRVPLLDHRLVELGWSLPNRFKLGASQGKLVLRELFRRRFGEQLASRRKQGFQVPVESWLAGPLGPALDIVLSPERLARHGLLAPRVFAPDRRRALLATRPLLLWNAFCLAVWCEVTAGTLDAERLREIVAPDRRAGAARAADGSKGDGLRAVS